MLSLFENIWTIW